MNELKSIKRLNKNKIKLKHNGGKIKKRNSKKRNSKKKKKSKRKYYRTKKGGSYASRPPTHADELKERLRKTQQNYTPPAGKKNTLTKYSKRSKPPSHTGKTPAMGEWMQYHQARHKSRLEDLEQEKRMLEEIKAGKIYNLGKSDIAHNYKIDVPGLEREKTEKQWTGWTDYLKDIPERVRESIRTSDKYDFSKVKFGDMQLNPDLLQKNTRVVTIRIWNDTTKKYDSFVDVIPEDTKKLFWEGKFLTDLPV